MGRRHSSDLPKPNKKTADRFHYICRSRYAGNQTQMAEDLGCSQSFLSRVLNGHKEAGPKLLKSLSKLPGINTHWAMTGEGKPFDRERLSGVPVARNLLPGAPKDHPEFLTGTTEAVAPQHARDTVYAIVVSETSFEHALPGDRVLLDLEPDQWKKNLNALDGKLCAVRRGDGIELRRVRCLFDDAGKLDHLLSFDPIETVCELPASLPSTVSDIEKDPDQNKLHRSVQPDDPMPTAPHSSETAVSHCEVIGIEDIVAIAIELFRQL